MVGKLQDAAEEAGYEEKADDWFDSSVKDINAKIKEYRKELKQEEKENKNDTNAPSDKGNGKGNGKSKKND